MPHPKTGRGSRIGSLSMLLSSLIAPPGLPLKSAESAEERRSPSATFDPSRRISLASSLGTAPRRYTKVSPLPSLTRRHVSGIRTPPGFPKPRKILSCGSRGKRIHKGAPYGRGIDHFETKSCPHNSHNDTRKMPRCIRFRWGSCSLQQ